MPAIPRQKRPCAECKTNTVTCFGGICKACQKKHAQRNKEQQEREAEHWRKTFDDMRMPDHDFDLRNINLIQPPHIPPMMLRRLIHLCHPDKHDGSEAAHTATLYLLRLKDLQ